MEHAWEMRNAYKILVGKPERKRPLGRATRGSRDKCKVVPVL
jgi:hypothetical protein